MVFSKKEDFYSYYRLSQQTKDGYKLVQHLYNMQYIHLKYNLNIHWWSAQQVIIQQYKNKLKLHIFHMADCKFSCLFYIYYTFSQKTKNDYKLVQHLHNKQYKHWK